MITVLAPLLVICTTSVLFWRYLMLRDRGLAIFEIGAFFMLATTAFAALPLIWYALSGMQFSILSHSRLHQLNPEPEQFAEVGWMYCVFMIAFALGYLGWRTRHAVVGNRLASVSRTTFVVVLGLWLLSNIFFFFLSFAFGVNFSIAYDESLGPARAAFLALPLIAQQFVQHTYGMLVILNSAVIVLLVANWKSKSCRVALFIWFAVSLVAYLLSPGGRFILVAMLITFAMAFHRFVRAVRISELVFGGLLLFSSFIAIGLARGSGSLLEQGRGLVDLLDGYQSLFTVADEFQNAYGSILEFKHNLEQGSLDPIPWQIYTSDFFLPFPQQILPFEKVDPVEWYVQITGPGYFNFSVLAQSALGFGWWELVLRGLLFGIALAAIHNWYARRPAALWRNVFYVWLAIVSYQSVRNTSLYLVSLVLYRFVPLLFAVHVGEWLIGAIAKNDYLSRPADQLRPRAE